MTFSVTPADLAQARQNNTKLEQSAAHKLVKAYVNVKLTDLQKRLNAGERLPSPHIIRVDSTVSHNSDSHAQAVAGVAEELRAAGFNAKHKTEQDCDDGPGRFSAGYEYIELKV